jgi:hypothetical protein
MFPTTPRASFTRKSTPPFQSFGKKRPATTWTISQSNGGSGKQARSVIDGLQADVVTLAVATDIDALHDKADCCLKTGSNGCRTIAALTSPPLSSWCGAAAASSVKNWDDLVRPGLSVITPNPKTSGGARWIYLAAYGWALQKNHGDAQAARRFVEQLYRNVPVMDEGARGSATTFVQRGIGDVLSVGRTKRCWWSTASGAGASTLSIRPRASGPSRPWRWWTNTPTSTARGRWRKPICAFFTRRGAGDRRPTLFSAQLGEVAARTRPFSAHENVHGGGSFRKLEAGAKNPLRRRRHYLTRSPAAAVKASSEPIRCRASASRWASPSFI